MLQIDPDPDDRHAFFMMLIKKAPITAPERTDAPPDGRARGHEGRGFYHIK